jgi:hypothetical protein
MEYIMHPACQWFQAATGLDISLDFDAYPDSLDHWWPDWVDGITDDYYFGTWMLSSSVCSLDTARGIQLFSHI